jgi:CubicO group peptidase (beta-lactamase class C family)
MKLLIWIFLLFTNITIAQTNEKFLTDSLTKELTELSNKNSIIGFSVAIVNQDSILYAKGFGYSNKDKKKLYTKNTVLPIASISKTLAGVALMKAQEMGKLNLDDDINDYLPFKMVNPYFPNNKITIRNLATHSSGLKDSRNYSKIILVEDFSELPKETRKYLSKTWCRKCDENKDMPMIDFIKNIYNPQGIWYKKKHFLKNPTGTKYKYTNNNATIAAYIIEQATGEKYNDFVKKYIIEPLKMTNSNWVFEGSISNDISMRYAGDITMPKMRDITYPDGSFVTNVIDFGNYLSTIISGYSGENNVLNSDSYKEMLSQQINTEFESGIFWEVVGSIWIGHSGGHAGVSTYAYFDKESLTGFILFGNTTDTKHIDKEEQEIIRALKKYSTE